MTGPAGGDWRPGHAEAWARTVLAVLDTPFPYAAAHVSLGPGDVDVTPSRLHPAFHGCLDWHSSVHMQWSAIRLLTVTGEHLAAATRRRLVAALDARLVVDSGRAEAAYLRARPGFERPYGWGWAAALAAAADECPLPEAERWRGASRAVFDAVEDLAVAWMPTLAHPVRHGEHSNTACGMALVHEAAVSQGRKALADAVADAAVRWFGCDRGYPAQWEPGGSDFLSPALCEADLMRRVLPADRFGDWLEAFLPGLAAEGDTLLEVPAVLDRADGKAVHLFGLALSRAWHLRLLAPWLGPAEQRRVAECTARQVASVRHEIVGGGFMSTHWLVSFALLAATAG